MRYMVFVKTIDAGGLGPGAPATEVRIERGRVSVTDGPWLGSPLVGRGE